MKTLTFSIFMLYVVSFISCKKDASDSREIYGIWKFVDSWENPGNGNIKYNKIKGKPRYMHFKYSGDTEGDAIPDIIRFNIINSRNMEIIHRNNPQPIMYQYKLAGNKLELNPPCDEGCGFRFTRR